VFVVLGKCCVDQFEFKSMRFKAKLLRENLLTLHNALSVLDRLGRSIVLYLTEECLRISVVAENPDSPKVFAEINQSAVFFDYRIESQSSNSILLEVELELLMRALGSGKQAPQSQLKLVKRGNRPFLCFESRVRNS
jgi:hypothetical protein